VAVSGLGPCRFGIGRGGREQFSSAEANVSNEASTLTTMYRQTVGIPVPEQTQLRELLRKYAKAVEGPEWEDAIHAGTGTESAREALNEMYRVLGSEQSSVTSSPISQKFLDQLTNLASERNQRILDAKPRIPGLLWTGLLFGGVVLLGLGGFMRLGSLRAHFALLSAVAVLLGLLLFDRLLARPSLREPAGRHVRTVRAITQRLRLNRPGDMISCLPGTSVSAKALSALVATKNLDCTTSYFASSQ